jgi:hypothetical protein
MTNRTTVVNRTTVSSFKKLASCLAVFFLSSGLALGQERLGELRGEATDPTGAVLPNIAVTATNQDTKRVYNTTTTGEGTYVITSVDPGRYVVAFELQGFQRYEVPNVLVTLGRILRVDARMQVGGTEQTVQVTEAAPLIDVTGTLQANSITMEEIDRLPKGRSFQSLVLTTPSTNFGEVEGGFQINGASGAENQFMIDGVSTTSLMNGKSRQNAVFEILQEVQVKTAGIDAEFGGALGGVVTAVTKSGGNDFHGDLHYYFSGNALSAGPTRRLVMDPNTERTAFHVQDYKNADNSHEVGYSVGGRLIKDRLFFFSAASPRYRNIEQDFILTDGRDTVKADRTYHQLFNKLSWVATDRLRGSAQWLWSPYRGTGGPPNYDSFANELATSVQSFQIYKQRGFSNPQNNYSGQVDITVTPTSLITIRGGRFWDNYKTTGIPNQTMVEFFVSSQNLPFDIPENLRQPANYSNIPRLRNNAWDISTRTYAQADYSLYANFLGQHNLKIGGGRQKNVNNVNISYPQGGFVRIQWNQALNRPALGGQQRGTYGFYEVHDEGTVGTTGGNIDSLFIQDQWRVLPRLTLTLGLRTEYETVPSFQRHVAENAFEFDWTKKMAPRVGASYDVFGNGRVKIFGSYGRYYDWVKYELARGTYGGQRWLTWYRTLDTLDVFSLSRSNMPGRNIWTADPNSVRDRRIPSFDSTDPDLKPMGTQLWNAGTEFQIASNTVFRASWIRNDLMRTIEDIGTLDAEGNEVYVQGNPGEGLSKTSFTTGLTKPFPIPKAKRTYDAMELVLTKRFSSGFFANASYTLSRLYGNYAGLANSDELTSPSTGLVSSGAQGTGAVGRQGGNVNRSWDLDEILFDARGNYDVQGRLATDRPHSFKLYGNRDFKWGGGSQVSDIGAFFMLASGTPLTTNVWTTNHIPVMVNGRGDMGRTPVLSQTDLLVGHTIRVGEGKNLRFEFNALNLFNQKTSRNRFNGLNREQESSFISLANVDLFQGFDYNALIGGTPDASGRGAIDPRFGLDDIFNPGFSGRFGIKFTF